MHPLQSAPGPSAYSRPAWLLVALLGIAVGIAPEVAAEAVSLAAQRAEQSYSEDEVKAAFLFHFATYAEWPQYADADHPARAVRFAVLQAPIIARELERFSADRTIKGRPVEVRRIRSLSQLDGDEVLFIGTSQNRRLDQLVRSLEGPTLVVTDSKEGLPDGGMINFQLVDRRVRFEIALPAAQSAGISLSSRLLSAALRVKMSRCYLECRVFDSEERYALVGVRTANPA